MSAPEVKNKSDEDAVIVLYLELLKRSPDAESLEYWTSLASEYGIEFVRVQLRGSDEFKAISNTETAESFRGYANWELDIFSEFTNAQAVPQPGFVVDFMGSRLRTTSLWTAARALDGQVTPPPIPSDFHSEAVEWIGVLKSIRTARDRFVAMELGAGLGPWIVAGGTGARARGIQDIRLYGVEADQTHYRLLLQNLEDNGFKPEQYVAIHGAVGVENGTAQWPVIEDSREDWGTRPIAEGGDAQGDYLGRSFSNFVDVTIVAMRDLIVKEPRWDLLHIDVQGYEVEICTAALDELNARVHWLVLGTHSRLLDGQMIAMLFSAGWILENEKPSKFRFAPQAQCLESMTYMDGVQVWRNPRLD